MRMMLVRMYAAAAAAAAPGKAACAALLRQKQRQRRSLLVAAKVGVGALGAPYRCCCGIIACMDGLASLLCSRRVLNGVSMQKTNL